MPSDDKNAIDRLKRFFNMIIRKALLLVATVNFCAFSFYGLAPAFAVVENPAITDFKPVSAPFSNTLCLGVKFAMGESLSNLNNLTELKVKWVREELSWSSLEPQPGQWRTGFPVEFLTRLKFYREHNIGVIFLLGYGNAKAYPNDTSNPANSVDAKRFANYAVHVAEFLKFAKVRFVLEILNEPHNQLPRLLGGNWQGKAPSPWVDHYASMVLETVTAVHAVDATIKLLTNDDMWIVHYWFMEAGLPSKISGFAIHPYTGIGDPEHTAVAYDTTWTRPFNVVDIDRSFRSAVRRLRKQGLSKLGKTPEIWITEWGWAVDGIKNSINDATLTAYLPRAFILAAAAGVNTTCWFSSHDAVDGPMGLTRNDNSKRDSYYAYRTLSEQLGDYTLVRHLMGSENPVDGVQGFLFASTLSKKLVVWNVSGLQKVITFTDDSNSAKAVDVLGRLFPITQVSIGKYQIKVGARPVYITGAFLDKPTGIEVSN
jgi:hypothetical protein